MSRTTRASFEELSNALDAMTEEEFMKYIDSEEEKVKFLHQHGWTWDEFVIETKVLYDLIRED